MKPQTTPSLINNWSNAGAKQALQSKINNSTALQIPTKGLAGTKGSTGFISSPMKPKFNSSPIQPFVPGTAKDVPMTNPTTSTGAPNITPGIPTTAGNSNLQGKDYFTALSQSSNPSEKQAGQTWLARNPNGVTPGLASNTQKNVAGATQNTTTQQNNGGLTPDQITAMKSPTVQNAVTAQAQKSPAQVAWETANPNGTYQAPTTPQVGDTKQNYQNVLNQGNLANNAMWKTGNETVRDITAMNQGESTAGVGGVDTNIPGANGNYHNLFAPQTTGNLAGEKGILNPLLNIAGTYGVGQMQQGQAENQMGLNAATTVANASNNVPTAQGQATWNAISGYQNGSGSGAGDQYFGAPSEVGTAGRISAYNNLLAQNAPDQAVLNTLQANSSLLNNTIKSAGTNYGSLPYLNGLQQMVSNGLLSQSDLASFTNMIGQLKAQGVNIDPNGKLNSIAGQLLTEQATRQNTINGRNTEMQTLSHQPRGTSNSTTPTGGTGSFSDSSFYGTSK